MKLRAAGILFPAFEIKNIGITFVHESSVSFEVFIHALKCTLLFTFPTCMLSTFMTLDMSCKRLSLKLFATNRAFKYSLCRHIYAPSVFFAQHMLRYDFQRARMKTE